MTAETKTTRQMKEKLEGLEAGSERHRVLETARRFKKSWIEMGAALFRVRAKELYRRWGFDKFEQYCQQELRIKPQTANKLCASYAFLREEDPSVLRRDGVEKPVPDVQVVDFLRRLKEKRNIPDDAFEQLKQQAWQQNAPASDIRRQASQYIPPPPPPPKKRILKQLLEQAHRLADALAAVPGIPRGVLERALALVDDLRSLAGGGANGNAGD